MASDCALCRGDGGALVWRGERLRVIHAHEPHFPAFYRVVWNAHAAEFTDLAPHERAHCMQAVALVEQVLREQLTPAKINLAALGNVVPHLHWHVIARFDWDSHFPAPVWDAPRRAQDTARIAALAARQPLVHDDLCARLGAWAGAPSLR
ncbi:MAG: HIT family protein [Comamonadaceae bacterium]|nr:HIT family protein [Burkholderiales bacterium]MEB2347443.1 HIT family protein [Comamonadaceae bacterium]